MRNLNNLLYTCLAFASLFCSAVAFATQGERHISLQEDVAGADLVRVNVSAGEVTVTGISGNKVTAEVTAQCRKAAQNSCDQLLKELAWSKQTGSVLELGLAPLNITRYDDIAIKVKLGVPQDKKLDVSLSAGELTITGTSACLLAAVNAGEINITLNEHQLASAELSARVGDVKLKTANGAERAGARSLLVGAKLDWQGTGDCHAKASVLTGEANLALK